MTADLYYDPTFGQQEWIAVFNCDDCEKDTSHLFVKEFSLVWATCEDCGHETEIDTDGFEG